MRKRHIFSLKSQTANSPDFPARVVPAATTQCWLWHRGGHRKHADGSGWVPATVYLLTLKFGFYEFLMCHNIVVFFFQVLKNVKGIPGLQM